MGRYMRLLYATDHAFRITEGTPPRVEFSEALSGEYFESFGAVFSQVVVAARVTGRERVGSRRRLSTKVRGVELSVIPKVPKVLHYTVGRWIYSFALMELVNSVDAVYVRLPSVVGSAASLCGYERGTPVAAEVAGDPSGNVAFRSPRIVAGGVARTMESLTRASVRSSSCIAYVSPHLRSRFPPEGSYSSVISNVRLADADFRDPEDTSGKEVGGARGGMRIAVVSNLTHVKNPLVVPEVVDELLRREAAPEVHWVGTGPLMDRVRQAAKDKDIEERFRWYGHVEDRDTIREVLDSADVYLIPSRSEGMPRALLEAMARSLPCVGSRVGGIASLLEDEYLFRPDAGEAAIECADAVERAIENRKGAGCRNYTIAREYRLSKLEQKRYDLLERLREHVD